MLRAAAGSELALKVAENGIGHGSVLLELRVAALLQVRALVDGVAARVDATVEDEAAGVGAAGVDLAGVASALQSAAAAALSGCAFCLAAKTRKFR